MRNRLCRSWSLVSRGASIAGSQVTRGHTRTLSLSVASLFLCCLPLVPKPPLAAKVIHGSFLEDDSLMQTPPLIRDGRLHTPGPLFLLCSLVRAAAIIDFRPCAGGVPANVYLRCPCGVLLKRMKTILILQLLPMARTSSLLLLLLVLAPVHFFYFYNYIYLSLYLSIYLCIYIYLVTVSIASLCPFSTY